jgi:hypothetical protein
MTCGLLTLKLEYGKNCNFKTALKSQRKEDFTVQPSSKAICTSLADAVALNTD